MFRGNCRFSIPYLGYIEATTKIPSIKNYDECVPMLILKSSSLHSLGAPVLLVTMVLDRAMVRITVEELIYAGDTWQQTYMSTMANASVASMIERTNDAIPRIDAPLVTTKPIMIPPFRCKWVKGLVESLPVCSYWVHVTAELMKSHWLTWEVKATSTYSDLHPGSRRIGMMLQNLSAWEFRIPPKMVIGNV